MTRLGKGLALDQKSAWEAWEKGNAEFKKGNSENLDLLIEATDYLDRTGESGIMSDFAEETDIDKSGNKEYTKEQRAADIQAFVKGEKTFDETLDAYAHLYSELVNSNDAWSWDEDVIGEHKLTRKMKREIKHKAITTGLIKSVPLRYASDIKCRVADFLSAELVREQIKLPEEMWLWSDKRQFAWLNEQIGGKVPGYTWHHSEIPGVMQLVPTGIHRIPSHNGGRSPGMWAYIGNNRNGGK